MGLRLLVFSIVCSYPCFAIGQNAADALIQGAWSGQGFVVRSSLESGRVDVDVKTPEGNTPLMLASLAGHQDVVHILLEAEADPNSANEDGESPLILASKYGFTDVAAALIEAGADANVKDTSGRSPWTWASWGENARLVKLLKASGADGSGKADPFDDGKPIDRFETSPKLTKYKAPEMPKDFRKTGLDGTLRLRLVVDRDGKPTSVELVEGLQDELDANALKAAKKWKFEAGEIQNKAVLGEVTATIDYRQAGDREGKVMVWTERWRN
jgi:TonB family protein